MNSICLSVAPNIRCEGLSRIENIALVIPPTIELFFSFTLALTNSSIPGKKRWILVCDGFSFFLLALADFFSHIIPQASTDRTIFTIVDFILGGLSFLPIFAYILFLYLFARSNLIKLLPSRFRRIMWCSLLALIPVILLFNELGSLLGITHGQIKLAQSQTTELGTGSSSVLLQRLALFFSSGTLVFMTLFQATLFFLSFIRLLRAFIDERRAESSEDSSEQIHLLRGLGWVSAGLKLGAIESVLGFANVFFAVMMARRILRLFGRGMIIIGVIKGVNIVEDLAKFKFDVMARRSSLQRSGTQLKPISRTMEIQPRYSTFHQMTPQATSFHTAQRERKQEGKVRIRRHGPSPLALGNKSTFHSFETLQPRSMKQRVTVHYDGRTPPVLNVRFSAIEIDTHPVPLLGGHGVKERDDESERLSVIMEGSPDGQWSGHNITPLPPAAQPPYFYSMYRSPAPPPATMNSNSTPIITSRSLESTETVRDLASRFPGLPPRVVPGRPPPVQGEMEGEKRDSDASWKMLARVRSQQRREQLENERRETEKDGDGDLQKRQHQSKSADVSPVNSIKRKPVPTLSVDAERSPTASAPSIYVSEPDIEASSLGTKELELGSHFYDSSDDESEASNTSHNNDISKRNPIVRPPPTYIPGLTRTASTLEETIPSTPPTPTTPTQQRNDAPLISRALRRRALASGLYSPVEPTINEEQKSSYSATSTRARASSSGAGAWLRGGPVGDRRAVAMARPGPLRSTDNSSVHVHDNNDEDEDAEAVIDEAWHRAGLTRIKSVNTVRVHTTPRAEQEFDVRGSMFVVQEDDLGLPASLEETLASRLRASVRSIASPPPPARGDSQVLGEEETRLVRERYYV